MTPYLKALGLSSSTQKNGSIELFYINNQDGSPRWFWNADNPNPDFLKFYAVSNPKSKAFAFAIRIIFSLKLQSLLFRKNKIWVKSDEGHAIAPFIAGNFALFTGTAGQNRKLVLYAKQQFVKIALNSVSNDLINNEQLTLNQLSSTTHVDIPSANKIAAGILSLTDIGNKGKRETTFTGLHARAIHELSQGMPIKTLKFINTAAFQKSLDYKTNGPASTSQQIPTFLIEKLETLGHNLSEKYMPFSWAHRDFTPWNCFVTDGKIKLYDFELSSPELPFGYDAIHFVMQQGILVDRLPWKEIKPKVQAAYDLLSAESNHGEDQFQVCLGAYLYLNTSYYLHAYSQQAQWHVQVNWQLQTWNDAISDLLSATEHARPLLIGDVFDFLQNENYATIKFPDTHPKSLSELADIDIISPKTTATNLYNYLSRHSLVDRIQNQKQSHMSSMLVVLKNGSMLALDLIWQLKRKQFEFLSVDELLSRAIPNNHAIYTLNESDTLNYLSYFYGLNMGAIPEKYTSLFKGALPDLNKSKLHKSIRSMPANTGLSGLKNRLNYLGDVVRRSYQRKGIIITFSGVDGAGKSTIIEHTKTMLEKKFRRKVVVIRHRPSLLPILSAITHGKAQAEQNAASTLPRQGTNKNTLSSLLRFGYYYVDYVFGQFYIYTRHVLRGEIVLYDRYYFDFINDSLRSNIRLPKWLTKAAYALLLQPELNFFLYADATTILNRKKELDAEAITQLTEAYLSLFAELNDKSEGKYIPIFNIRLQDSLRSIYSKIQMQLV